MIDFEKRTNVAAFARDFYVNSSEQYDGLIIGEREAKDALLVGQFQGSKKGGGVALAGPPATGKSALIEHGHMNLDLKNSDVAFVPHIADLTGTKLLGGVVSTSEFDRDASGEVIGSKTRTIDVEGIMRPGKKVAAWDEITRVSTYAINAALGIFENGRASRDNGDIIDLDIDYIISGANPHENGQGTFRLPKAYFSRQITGAVTGPRDEGERDNIVDAIFDGFSPTDPEAVAKLSELQESRLILPEIRPNDTAKHLGKLLTKKIADVLNEYDVLDQGDPRIAQFILGNSRTWALFGGRIIASEEDVLKGARQVAMGQMAIAGVKSKRHLSLMQATEEVWGDIVHGI